MPDLRLLTNSIYFLLLPILVVVLGWPIWAAVLLVVVGLLWRWAAVIAGLLNVGRTPALVLESIPVSHFVEKVRWCLDRAGIEYVEEPWAGTLGAYYKGRTVPMLRARTGLTQSTIGNSSDILRYLWGRYGGTNEAAAFLEPNPDRLDLEKQLDRFGGNLQVWLYSYILNHRDLALRAWGAGHPDIPAWQRLMIRLLFPVQSFLIRKSFGITPERVAKAKSHIENLLVEIDTALADGRKSILGGDTINYTDIAFAAMCGFWLREDNYGGAAPGRPSSRLKRYPLACGPTSTSGRRTTRDPSSSYARFMKPACKVSRRYPPSLEERLMTTRYCALLLPLIAACATGGPRPAEPEAVKDFISANALEPADRINIRGASGSRS